MKGTIKKELKRRRVVEPIIGNLKSDHALGRNFLTDINGDKINALLAGIGYNFRLLLRWLRFFCFKIVVRLWVLLFKNSESDFYRFARG